MRKGLLSVVVLGAAVVSMSTCVMGSKIDFSNPDTIKIVQEKLNTAGFDCGTPDGVAGSGTKAAIQSFRETNGLENSEEIDAELFNALTLNKEQNGFVKAVCEEADRNLGEGEKLDDVTLYNNDLCLSVDLGDTSDSDVPAEDIALARVSSLTDAILELDNFEHLWETITVDFGDLGEVVNGKDNIKDDGNGKYFDSAKFELKKDVEANSEGSEAPTAGDDAAAASSDGVTPEVKEFLDSYESVMNKYCDFMENYDPNDITAMAEYLTLMQEYTDFAAKADAMDESSMTDADYKYYIDVMARVEKRLIDVSS